MPSEIFSYSAGTTRTGVIVRRRKRIDGNTGNTGEVLFYLRSPFDPDGWAEWGFAQAKWAFHFDSVEQEYDTYELAKAALLNHLWWYADDVHGSDPELYRDLMQAWQDVVKWCNSYSPQVITVRGTEYSLRRRDGL